MENINNNVSEQATVQSNSMLEKQGELENAYKSICAQEVLLIDQLKQVQDQRKACAGQLELVRSICSHDAVPI